jgi:hypothetical protein
MIFERFLQWLAERERQRCFRSHTTPQIAPPNADCAVCHTPRKLWHRWSCNFARHVDIDAYAAKTKL